MIAARVLGRKIAPIISKSATLQQRIAHILDDNIQTARKSGIAVQWAERHGLTIDYARKLLSELRTGINVVLFFQQKNGNLVEVNILVSQETAEVFNLIFIRIVDEKYLSTLIIIKYFSC